MSVSLEPPYDAADGSGMLARIDALAQHVEQALERGAAESWGPPSANPDLVAVGALGGSAIAADLTAGVYADRMPHPLLTVRDYHWPAWLTKSSLALLCSYSGNTEETLSLYREAGAHGALRAAISSGGQLSDWCVRDGVPCAPVPGGSPPRAALFGSWVAMTGLLRGLGWIDDPTPAWRETVAVLRAGAERLGSLHREESNPAKRLARALHGRLFMIYCGSERLGAVATRWRNQLNENAKLLGHSALVPEMNHNEIVGWENPGPAQRVAGVVLLHDREDSPETTKRLALTGEYVAGTGAKVYEWTSVGESRLARIASLVQSGDYLSFYMAVLNGVDPTPIASIDEFKRRLQAG